MGYGYNRSGNGLYVWEWWHWQWRRRSLRELVMKWENISVGGIETTPNTLKQKPLHVSVGILRYWRKSKMFRAPIADKNIRIMSWISIMSQAKSALRWDMQDASALNACLRKLKNAKLSVLTVAENVLLGGGIEYVSW